jgi:hypothetical protein
MVRLALDKASSTTLGTHFADGVLWHSEGLPQRWKNNVPTFTVAHSTVFQVLHSLRGEPSSQGHDLPFPESDFYPSSAVEFYSSGVSRCNRYNSRFLAKTYFHFSAADDAEDIGP